MHRGVRPHPWTIHQAIEVLNPLFNPGKKVSGKRISWSIYASTYVEDEEMFHNELVQALISEWPDVKVTWLDSREILKGKKE